MASDDDKRLVDRTLETLAGKDRRDGDDEELRHLEELAERVEEPGLQDRIMERYLAHGRELLSDALPSQVDPRIAKRLEPWLGEVGHVRVHSGRAATEAARAMGARAFALGDADVFVDEQQFNPQTRAGGALLAHELAHLRDAGTGFAMSREQGGGGTAREAFAEAVEMTYAQEEADAGRSVESEVAEAPPPRAAAKSRKPRPDLVELEDRVWEALQKMERTWRDRSGG